WLTSIAAHAALKVVRKQRGLPTQSLDAATSPDDSGRIPHPEFIADWRETPDQLLQRTETRHLLDTAISGLDPGHRAVFLLRDVEEFSVRDTAKALRISEANVKVRLLRARLQGPRRPPGTVQSLPGGGGQHPQDHHALSEGRAV
ncbi:MAG: sigma-70 family RNA polymerase sigma factor, partial [Kiritimatiellia bacterium]